MTMPKPWKHPRTGVYWFRRGVPRDCQEVVGKREWNQSLQTKSLREAERALLPLLAETNQLIDDIRAGTYRRYADDDLERIAIWWCSDLGATIEAAQELNREGFPGAPVGDEDRELPIRDERDLDLSLQGFLHRLDWSDLGPKIESDWPDYQRLRQLAFEEHYHSQVVSRPPVLQRLEGQPAKIKPDDGPGFLEVFESYLRERQPREKTVAEFRKSVSDFLSLHGGDVPIQAVTKQQVVGFKNLLLQKPKRLSPKQRKMRLREIVESTNPDTATISTGTVNKVLVPIHAVLEYAVQQGSIQSNPAQRVKATRTKSVTRARLPYTVDDLNKIIASLNRADKHPERYWLPLLALFTGARLEEMAQLFVTDIREQEGIHFLNIAEIEEGQSVKNLDSIRRIPIPPVLIKLGFLDLVKQRNKVGAKMLFDLKPYRGVYSHSFSKWYGRHVRQKVGISDQRKVFHSYRHSFKDAGRECGIETSLVDALQGHTDRSVSGSYGSGYSLKALDKAMRRIRYPGLDLSCLS